MCEAMSNLTDSSWTSEGTPFERKEDEVGRSQLRFYNTTSPVSQGTWRLERLTEDARRRDR